MSFNGLHKLNPDWIIANKDKPPEKDYFGWYLAIIIILGIIALLAVIILSPSISRIDNYKNENSQINMTPTALHFFLFRMRK